MTRRILLVLVLLFSLSTFPADAQVRVTKAGAGKSTIVWSGFTADPSAAATEFRRTLQFDLQRSGWFVNAGQGGGEYSVLGTCAQRGNRLQAKCQVYATATRQNMLSKTYSATPEEAAVLAHRAADDIVEAVTGRKGIASTRIAMVGTRTGKKELYICGSDGRNLVQLTRDRTVSVAPKWGPEGKQLVYTSYLKRFPDVYVVDIASGDRRRLAGYPGLNTGAAFSPDGRDLALILSKDGNPELYIKNIKSGALTRLTQTPKAAEASPSWSPDGERLVFVSDRSGRPQIYMLSRRGGNPVRLTSRGTENVAPDWGPNGLVAYAARIGGRYQVCVMDPDSREIKQLSLDGADYEDPSWAPDGRHIVCSRTEQHRAQVYLLDTMGDRPVALTDHRGDWYSPSWSPQ